LSNFPRIQDGESLIGIALPNSPTRDAKPETPIKMRHSAHSPFGASVEPNLAIPMEAEASLLDATSVQGASERRQVDFVQLERLTR
jgi:hypothetical protein